MIKTHFFLSILFAIPSFSHLFPLQFPSFLFANFFHPSCFLFQFFPVHLAVRVCHCLLSLPIFPLWRKAWLFDTLGFIYLFIIIFISQSNIQNFVIQHSFLANKVSNQSQNSNAKGQANRIIFVSSVFDGKLLFLVRRNFFGQVMHSRWSLMRQGHESEGWMHWTSIKIEAKVHYFVTILEHKVSTQLLI